MLKTTGLTITTPTIIPVPMFFTLAQENKREGRTAATMGVTVCEVSHRGVAETQRKIVVF